MGWLVPHHHYNDMGRIDDVQRTAFNPPLTRHLTMTQTAAQDNKPQWSDITRSMQALVLPLIPHDNLQDSNIHEDGQGGGTSTVSITTKPPAPATFSVRRMVRMDFAGFYTRLLDSDLERSA
jgi:hypothetical protein